MVNEKVLNKAAFSDEARLLQVWPQLEELALAFPRRTDKLPDLYIFRNGFKIEFGERISQLERRELLNPQNWQFREWRGKGVYELSIDSAVREKQLFSEKDREEQRGKLIERQALLNLPPEDGLMKLPLERQFVLADYLFNKLGQWRRDNLKLSWQRPYCLLTFPDESVLLCWKKESELIGSEEIATEKGMIKEWERLRGKLLEKKGEWGDFLERCRRSWRKPRLSAETLAAVWAPILLREAEQNWREQLVKLGVRPTFYAFGLRYREWGEEKKMLLDLVTINYAYFGSLGKREQLLALDDVRLWNEKRVAEEFRIVTDGDLFNEIQQEVYLLLLREREELKEDWLWEE